MRMRTFAIVVRASGCYLLSSIIVGATPIPPNPTIGSDMRTANHVPRDPSPITLGTSFQLFRRMNGGNGAPPSTTTLSLRPKPPQSTDESSHTVEPKKPAHIAWDDVKCQYSIPDELYSRFHLRCKNSHYLAGIAAVTPGIENAHLLTTPSMDSFRELREFETLLQLWWRRLGYSRFPQKECRNFQDAIKFARSTLTAVRKEIPEPFRNDHQDNSLSLSFGLMESKVDEKVKDTV